MPMTLNVGLSKKIGQPNYGSLGCSCNVQVELPANLVFDDPETFHRQVKNAYLACSNSASATSSTRAVSPVSLPVRSKMIGRWGGG